MGTERKTNGAAISLQIVGQCDEREEFMDCLLTNIAKRAMSEKLELSRNKGRGGWYEDSCSVETLKQMLLEHIEKGDMVDVMNFAAMIYAKETMFAAGNKS